MDSLWSSRDAAEPPKADADVSDVQAPTGPVPVAPDPPSQTHKLPIRPPMRREELQAPPPPAPAPPSSASGQGQGPSQPPQPTDSLSLMQLRRIVAEFKQPEIVAYDFVYADVAPHAEEIDEWFVYQFWQWVRLNGTQRAFEWHWQQEYHTSWEDASLGVREAFVREAVQGIKAAETSKRLSAIQRLFYVVLGRWSDSASAETLKPGSRCAASSSQLAAIKEGVIFLTRQNGVETVWKALQNSFEGFWSDDFVAHGTTLQEAMDEFMNLMTMLYICIQQTLDDRAGMAETQRRLFGLNPSLVDFLLSTTSKLRWDEAGTIPQAPIFLLFWKSILLVFGGSDEIKEAKAALRETDNDSKDPTRITASPLDYHVFRQEITSKYPAYIPPQPLIPLEADQSSLLPPIPNNPNRNNNGANGILPAPASNQSGGGASILHQPVHIATPAPSPPPSPGVGGKGGKKQNYQTNQNFPFMYPPLDANSNSAGGKGGAGLQMLLVGRKWEGSDVPKSIAEAGDLFSQRVRMTRATRQLWEERERFLKSERGWDASDASDDEIEDLDLDGLTTEEREEIDKVRAENRRETIHMPKPEIDYGPHPEEISESIKARLEAVEKFYENSLPQLQSMVIVLLKAILMNVTAIMAQAQAAQQHPGAAGRGNAPNGTPASARPQDGSGSAVESPEQTPEEVDAARTREITAKAVTGILVLLLKWLKISHVLKFEYLTQLLLDSNYLPLVLKLFAHQDIQQVVDSKTDRIENSFFHFCNLRAAAKHNKPSSSPPPPPPPPPPAAEPEAEEESEDEAAPPPIKRRRSPQGSKHQEGDSSQAGEGGEAESQQQPAARPEVDELGYPVNMLPKEPITDFSQRNFFSLINYLRIMQKICKNKAHRNLLLVQYKSGNILRKSLKVPQPELRLYTLKLFKNQVPYWGRKWRQSNMRVITAVYLYCRPELRDEWLAGSDVDAEVDAAVPLEQALRSLTHWFNVRRYPDKIAEEVRHALKDEQGFFVRELEKIDLSWPEAGPEESVSGEWEYEAATN